MLKTEECMQNALDLRQEPGLMLGDLLPPAMSTTVVIPDPKLISPRFDRLTVRLWFDGLTTPRKIEGRLTRSPALTLRPCSGSS